MPSVSIVIPVHNRAAELPQTLDSVAAQTLADWECWVVDDRSTDGAADVAKRYAANDARFKAIALPPERSGAPAARNLGVERSAGEFVLFLDSDDLLSPTCLERRVAHLRSNVGLDFVLGRCGLFRREPHDIPHLWNADTGVDDLDRLLQLDVPWQTTSPLWRRSALAGIGGWDESVLSGQDWEFHLRSVAAGLRYERLSDVDCFWRVPDDDRDSIGKDYALRPDHARNRPATVRKMLDLVRAKGLLTHPRQRLFGALFFQAAEQVALKVSRREGRDIWREALDAGLVSADVHAQGNRYLFALRSPDKAAPLRRAIEKSWPRENLVRRGKFFNRAPADPSRPPTVSVVVSAYNNADYVASAIGSIQRQSFRDFELIVVNDGSTDDTGPILRELAESDCRIKLIDRPNKGLTASLNEALSHARGEFVARMDADDVAMRTRFERQVEYLRANPDCVLLGTNVKLIDPYDVPLDEVYELHVEHAAIDRELMKGRGGAVCHPAVMMRADAVRKVGGYREEYNNSEDLDLFLRLADVGRVHNLPDVLLHYRRHLGSVNQLKFENQWKMKRAIVGDAYRRRGIPMADDWTFNAWRPADHGLQLRQWGWVALKHGNVHAARQHAKQAIRKDPWNLEAWKLAACALRGH